MVHVVRADHRARELLHYVVLFVGALGGGEHGDAVRAGLSLNLPKTFGHEVQGLVPTRLLELAVPPDEGRGETVGVVDEIVSERALHAQAAVIGRAVVVPGDLDDLAAFGVDDELAADAAVGAGGDRLLQVPGPALETRHLLGQGAGRANADALAAGDAVGVAQRHVKGTPDVRAQAALVEIEDVVYLHFIARDHAPPAQDAAVHVAYDHLAALVHVLSRELLGKRGALDAHLVRELLEEARAVRLAGEAFGLVVPEQKVHDQAPRPLHALGVRVHDHAVRRGQGTRGLQALAALHFHNAYAAASPRPVLPIMSHVVRKMAEDRDVHAHLFGRLKDGRPRGDGDVVAVDGQGDFRQRMLLVIFETLAGSPLCCCSGAKQRRRQSYQHVGALLAVRLAVCRSTGSRPGSTRSPP